ncbi:MAG: hypothetical protein FWD93_04140 [Coriobacteriia bacterium]|nr:hypothetical protein [Coriobacteriia bacterium]
MNNTFSKVLSYGARGLKCEIVTNNLRTVAIHGAIVLLYWLVRVIPIGILNVVFLPILLAAYVCLSYKYLIPLPRRNLLSVSLLAGFLGVAVLFLYIYIQFFSAWNTAAIIFQYLNYPTFLFAQVLLLPPHLLYLIESHHFFYLPMIMSMFMPSLLMYLGLRLKIRKQNRV